MSERDSAGVLAAIDLGSNSFRLEICEAGPGPLQRVDYCKDTVRLGAGLGETRLLDDESMSRGWACMARFAERVRGLEPRAVRAVATATLREALNRDVFLARAQSLLGLPIDVISGHEEARLIYGGVAHYLPEGDERRLVFDIGGRSTEVILGRGKTPGTVESYAVGSVELSLRYFADGRVGARSFEAARVAAQAALEGAQGVLAGERWDAVYGASGTVGAVSDVLRAEGLSDGTITARALDALVRRLIDAGHADKVQLAGLKDDRRPVIGGGVAIVCALVDLLNLERIAPARGALRHGVMIEMLDRDAPARDIRSASVQRLQRQFAVDVVQAQRVTEMALWLFAALHVEPEQRVQRAHAMLRCAAALHEVGMAVSHESHHRHGEYIVRHADAAGFADHQLGRLATLVLAQRGGLRKVEDALAGDALLRDQALALRLAIVLCHARRNPAAGRLRLGRSAGGWLLLIDTPWADTHPQSIHLLREEEKAWSRTAWPLALHVD
ncbi:MAG TPA: Ppx/GppA phosphatase family protein [Burkholderiaceae bacterium]|nr:Ppx/GppA phosphatase family protein [Burkholderiaceae bacterium]